MTSLDIALACVRRGWYVLPIPYDGKRPIGGLVRHGLKDATLEEEKVRHWFGKARTDANVAINCGMSGLAVVDCDKGNRDQQDFALWSRLDGIPATYTVRSGRRSGFGTHSYFTVPEPVPTVTWERNGRSGEIRSDGGYVLAAGCIHKDSKQPYEVFIDAELMQLPEHIRTWKTVAKFDLVSDGSLDALRTAFEALNLPFEDRGNKLFVPCPWADGHSEKSGASEAAVFVKNGVYCFKCQHASCNERSFSQFRVEAFNQYGQSNP